MVRFVCFILTRKIVLISSGDAEELYSYIKKTLNDIDINIIERGAHWNINIRQQYENKLKSYFKEPQEQLTIDDI